MSYPRPEHLGSHGERRVIGILTLTNVAGGLVGLGGLWLLSGLLGQGGTGALSPAWLLRAALALAGALAGIVATFRWSGISLWDGLRLWVGYQIRRRGGRTLLQPPAVARRPGARSFAPVLRDGQVLAEVYDPFEARAPAEIAAPSAIEAATEIAAPFEAGAPAEAPHV